MLEANAVFSGGGVKGIALVGAVQVCEDLGYRWHKLAGTSSGSIVAALLAAGYKAIEIREMMQELDYKKIIANNFWDRIPLGRPIRVLFKKGMYSGEYLERWIERKLADKRIHTFADLPKDRLQIIASNLSKGKILQFPKDVEEIGLTARKLKVSKAVRMSISIPFLFDPLRVKKGNTQYIVDGGVISNFPVWLFDHDSPETIPTFGFNLRSRNPDHFYKISNPFSMLYAIISIMLESQDLKYIEHQDAVRTIFIPTDGVKSTDFSIDKKTEELLFFAGEKAAKKFFRTWNFDDYVTRYVHNRKIDLVSRVI